MLAYRTTAPTFFWDSIKAVAEAEVPGGERTSSDTPIARSTKVGRVEHSSGEPTSSEFSGTTRTGSSGTTSQRPNREAWRTSASQSARNESGTRFFGETTRPSQSHIPVPGALSAAPTFLVSQCAESVVDGAVSTLARQFKH